MKTAIIPRLTISALFFWSAAAKFFITTNGPTIYQKWLTLYPSLHFIVPGAEIFIAAWLLTGLWPRGASILTMLTVSAFSGVLIHEISLDYPRPCGCMGEAAAANEPGTIRLQLLLSIARNVLIIVGAAYIHLRAMPRRTAPPIVLPPSPLTDILPQAV